VTWLSDKWVLSFVLSPYLLFAMPVGQLRSDHVAFGHRLRGSIYTDLHSTRFQVEQSNASSRRDSTRGRGELGVE